MNTGDQAGGPGRHTVGATSWRDLVDPRRVAQVASLLLAAVAAAFLLGAPMYTGDSVSSDGTTTPTSSTLAEVNGRWVAALVLAPAVLIAVHTLWVGRGRRAAIVVCTAPVAVLCLLGILTIGVFYLPAVILSGVSLLLPARDPAPRPA